MLQMTQGSNKKSRRACVALTWLCALSALGVACENRLLACLHWLFSLANPSGAVAFRVTHSVQMSGAWFFFFLVPLSEFIPAADNYSKFGESLQGAATHCGGIVLSASPFPDYAFSFFFYLFFMRLCVLRDCVWRALRVAERSSGCHIGVALCEAGASSINVCWCRRLQRCEGMWELCCYLLLCLCTAANPWPANGITARDEWALG